MSGSGLAVLRQISYYGGGLFRRTEEPGDPPRDTRDIRYQLCTDHHTACDCREAELGEVIAELRSENQNAERNEEMLVAIARLHTPRPGYHPRCEICLSVPWPCPTRVLAESTLSPWERARVDRQDVYEETERLRDSLKEARAKIGHAADVLKDEARLPTRRVSTALEYLDRALIEEPPF